jgi:hypothetical protein
MSMKNSNDTIGNRTRTAVNVRNTIEREWIKTQTPEHVEISHAVDIYEREL